MSSLVLLRKNEKHLQRLEAFIKPRSAFYKKFDLPDEPDLCLILWAAQRSTTALYTPMQSGDFVAVAGTFFFENLTGEEAAQKFYASFDPQTFNWVDCTGHFVLVIRKNGKIYSFNDALAVWKTYTNTSRSYISAGFLEALLLEDRPSFDPQGVYEYTYSDFTIGETTFVASIKAFLPATLVQLQPDGTITSETREGPVKRLERPDISAEEMIAYQRDVLEKRFEKLSCLTSDDLISSISGGFDSRLMVSFFAKMGLSPKLFVYGRKGDSDVVPAQAIADYLGMPFRHVDKSKMTLSAADKQITAEDALYYYDGWGEAGLSDIHTDIADRKHRGSLAPYMANGKLGEIYRHYYYLQIGRKGVDLDTLMEATFGRVTPQIMPIGFDAKGYAHTIAKSFRAMTGLTGKRIDQADFQYMYSKSRMALATGRDIVINHRYSHALYPYVEPELCNQSLMLNFTERQYGKVQGAMIKLNDPDLARIPSSYGFNFYDGPTLSYRAKMALSYGRPLWLRKRVPAVQNMLHKSKRGSLYDHPGKSLLSDKTLPYMQRYFRLENVTDDLTASHIYAMELVGQYFNFE